MKRAKNEPAIRKAKWTWLKRPRPLHTPHGESTARPAEPWQYRSITPIGTQVLPWDAKWHESRSVIILTRPLHILQGRGDGGRGRRRGMWERGVEGGKDGGWGGGEWKGGKDGGGDGDGGKDGGGDGGGRKNGDDLQSDMYGVNVGGRESGRNKTGARRVK